jgi:NAD(P)-dependent dehydrogenase (short-subunit alcohol dehydrogenase family)
VTFTEEHHPAGRRSAARALGRTGEVGDIVGAITTLANARFMTGEILHVDGGRTADH